MGNISAQYVDGLEMRIQELEEKLEKAWRALALYGVPIERARSIPNGIAVLVSRMDKELFDLKSELAKWQRPFDAKLFEATKQQASHQDSLAAMRVYITALENALKVRSEQPLGTVESIDEDGEGGASCWVVLEQRVELGQPVFAHPKTAQSEPVAWYSPLGNHSHIVWGSVKPDDNIHTESLHRLQPNSECMQNEECPHNEGEMIERIRDFDDSFRYLRKWLNEGITAPIDRVALATVLAHITFNETNNVDKN
jgi:hypothetical protein